jgi:flagellar biosynthetic protein FliR
LEFFILNFEKFMLVFSRIMGLTLTATFFSSDSFLTEARLGLTFMVTAVIFPIIYQFIPEIPKDFFSYALLAVGEGLIGAAIGLCIDMFFSLSACRSVFYGSDGIRCK